MVAATPSRKLGCCPLALISLLLALVTRSISATLHVPSQSLSFLSMPAMFYGKPWIKGESVTAYLQYLDLDWCAEADKMNGRDPPSSPPFWLAPPPIEGMPLALLVNDTARADERVQHYRCHLIDFERLAMAWNVSYIIFYDGMEERPLSYVWSYLDDRVLSEDNVIGFQLVSHSTGMELRSMMSAHQSPLSLTKNKTQTEDSGFNLPQLNEGAGLVIVLDAKSGTKSGPRFDPPFVNSRKAVALVPKFTGFLSLLGSSYILFDIVVRNRGNKKFQTTFHRLLIGLSVADLLSSLAYFLSHWMFPSQVPVGTDPEWYHVMFPYSTGNQATCVAQGVIVSLGQLASILFTACISIQFVLKVRYRWTASQMKRAEYFFFTIGILVPLVTVLSVTSIGAMNPTAGGSCWIGAYPFVCVDSYLGWCRENKRWGVHQDQYKLFLGTVPILIGLFIVLSSMVLLYLTARRCAQEEQQRRSQGRRRPVSINNNRNDSPRRRSVSSTNRAHQRRAQKTVLLSASLYLGAYIFIYFIVIAAFLSRGAINVVLVVALPIQGFVNAMIYSGRFHHILSWGNRKRIIGEGARGSNSISISGLSMLTSSRILSTTVPNSLYENKNSNKLSTGDMSSDTGQVSISIAPPDVTAKSVLPMVVVKPEAAQ